MIETIAHEGVVLAYIAHNAGLPVETTFLTPNFRADLRTGVPDVFVDESTTAYGALTWGRSITLARRPSGEAHTAEFMSADGAVIGREAAHFYAYDHLPGGYLLVPDPTGAETASTRVTFRGPRVASAVDRPRPD